jgi:hypothetical protein
MWASGRHFDEALIERIQAAVDADPEISRRALSRQVCEWMDWRSPKGKPQEMACRTALLDLERKGALQLPQASKGHAFEKKSGPALDARAGPALQTLSLPRVEAALAELGPVEVVAVSSRYSQASGVWNHLMDVYHYLGAGPLCGAQIRYLVRCARYGWLGALAFSSPTLRLRAREKWIGWSERARRANLGRVILNSRFLILPTVEVANLASHVLSRALGQVAQDWETRYGQRPVLVETFVDPERFHGGCYQAANWVKIGQSAGGKRAHPKGKRSQGPKDLYVYPLSAHFRDVLCREPARRPLGEMVRPSAPADWAEEEFGALDVSDGRLRERVYTLARDFFAKPLAPIPQACDGSTAKVRAAYRFFRNPQVNMELVLDSHAQATVDRIRAHPVVLAVQDTTDLDYTHHALATLDLGPLQSIDDLTVGLKLHETIAFTPEGVPLGLLGAKCWARDGSSQEKDPNRPIEEKESVRWLESYRRVAEVQRLCPDTRLVSVGDRESDLYELLEEASAESSEPKPGLLVRAHKGRQRRVETEPRVKGEPLWDYMARQPVAAYPKLLIPRNGHRREREATLAVRHARVKLKPPKGHKGPALWVWALYAHEVGYHPAEVKEPVSWMLLTTVDTSTAEQALERLGWYAKRWGIEVFHRILKSGCRIEDRQLGSADRIETCLAIDLVIAWRIQWLTVQGQKTPDVPCEAFLAEAEWQSLSAYVFQRPPPAKPPTLRDALRMIAKLGGFLGRKGDGEPGPMALWRGLMRLPDLAAGWMMAVQFGRGARAGP